MVFNGVGIRLPFPPDPVPEPFLPPGCVTACFGEALGLGVFAVGCSVDLGGVRRRARVCFMGSVRVWVISLAGDGFRPVIVVSFRPLGSVRVVTVAPGSFLASLFMAVFWAAMAVCFFVVKPAVVNPGCTFSPNMLLRTALVREAAEGRKDQQERGYFSLQYNTYLTILSTLPFHPLPPFSLFSLILALSLSFFFSSP